MLLEWSVSVSDRSRMVEVEAAYITVRVTACQHSLQLAVCSSEEQCQAKHQLMARFNDLRGSQPGAVLV